MNTLTAASSRLLLASLWCLPATLSAQILQPVTVNVSASFTNPSGAVRTRLLAANGPGMTSFAAGGRTTEAVTRVAGMAPVPPGSRLAASAPLTVDAAGFPSWRISTTTWLDQYGQQFFSGPSSPLAVAPGGGPYTQTFQHSVSIVDVQFGTAVSGGNIVIYSADKTITYGQVGAVNAGSTHCELVVPGAKPLVIEASLETGSGGESGSTRKIFRRLSDWTAAGVPDNTVQTATLNLSEATALGSYTGTFSLAGTEVLAVPAGTVISGSTNLSATYFSTNSPAYGSWRRSTVINNAGSATGPFTLANLASTASIAATDPGPSSGYGVQAAAMVRRTLPSGGLAVQYLRTRLMPQAELPAVPGGGSASLGNRFVMTPASIRGTMQLRGPLPLPGYPALLSGIQTAADTDSNNDGLPEGAGALINGSWIYQSGIFSNTTVNNNSSYGGTGWQILERSYTAPDVQCEYDLAIASPFGETATWTAPGITLVMQNSGLLENNYFSTSWSAQNRLALDITGVPGGVAVRSDTMDLGEVTLILRSSSGSGVNIWQPRLLWTESALTGAPSNTWEVSNITAYGWPPTSAGATGRASLRTLLPAGTYTVRPAVQTTGGSTTLAPFTITVPSRGRITVDNGLTLDAGIPGCISRDGALVNGTVASGGVPVTSITYSIDGGAPRSASFVSGDADPPFSFNTGSLPAGTHTITVTVTTDDGRTATATYTVQTDSTPPVIQPIADIVLTDAPFGGLPVDFPNPVITDDCGVSSFTFAPASGSVFPMGTTPVTCTARDVAGNTSTRTFNVILRPACPTPVRSYYYSGNPGSWFRHPDKAAYHESVYMSIEAWVKRTDGDRCETIVSQNFQNSFWFGFCPKLRFYRSGGSYADADGDVPANQWTHVAVSYDGASASFYINGQPAGTKPLSNSGPGAAGPVTIGSDFTLGFSDYAFRGWLNEIHIFNAALTAADFGQQRITRTIRHPFYPMLPSSFGTGGPVDDLNPAAVVTTGPDAPQPMTEGILPKYSVLPRTRHPVNIDGVIDTVTEYEGADKMVIRYFAGPIPDAIAHMVYREEPTDQALYIGISGLRDVVAPWTRAQSFVAIYFQVEGLDTSVPVARPAEFRFCRRLDGGTAGNSTPVGFQRGNGGGNYAALAPGDSLASVPSPFGIIGGGGSTMEFRFDRSIFGSAWKKAIRIGISHHWISGLAIDVNAPANASFADPESWSDTLFSGGLPDLEVQHFGNSLWLTFMDPGCNFFLQSSSTMEPGSWVDLAAPVLPLRRDDVYREAIINMSLSPRKFFRLQRR